MTAEAATPLPPVPPAYGALPYLTIRGAREAIAWYQTVLGARVVLQLDGPDGGVVHAELAIGPASFMLTEERPQMGAVSPQALGGCSVTVTVFVADVDAVFQRAVAAGGIVGMPLADQFWGDRAGQFTDPWGQPWMLASRREVVDLPELQRRMAAMMDGCAPA